MKALSQYNSINNWGWLEDTSCLSQIEIVSGDIRDPFFCNEIVSGMDCVFHLAALIAIPYSYVAPQSYVETNVTGTLNIVHCIDTERPLNESIEVFSKYEDLVQYAHKTINQTCRFLDIEFSSSMLNSASFIDNSGNFFDSNSSFFQNRNNIDSESVYVWISNLEEYEIYLVELITKNSLLEFEYELSDIKLSKTGTDEVNEILNDNYIKPRFNYWKKFKNRVQAYPDSNTAYSS